MKHATPETLAREQVELIAQQLTIGRERDQLIEKVKQLTEDIAVLQDKLAEYKGEL